MTASTKYMRTEHALQPLRFPMQGRLPEWFFNESGGIQISGDSGTGKSTLMEAMMQALIRRGFGFCLLDPHGDLARQVRDFCLSLGDRITPRVYYVAPGDTSIVTALNPLALERAGVDEYTWAARLSVKIAHVSHILLHAWGESDFNSRPRLFKWTTRLVRTIAMAGLSFADIRHFLDVTSPLFTELIEVVPDLFAQTELAELSRMRPADRENLIESTKNRLLGFLENPVVETSLSRIENVVNVTRLMREQAIILVNLEPVGVLRGEDQQILANLWLNEILHAVYNCPQAERVPYCLFIDELPVFESCAPQLTEALRQIRKM